MTPNTTTAVAPVESARQPIPAGNRGLVISDMDSLWRFAGAVAASGLAPKGIQTREAIFVAVQMGLEVGLTPMASLQNIAVINGRPTIWGDAQLAVVRSTGELEIFEEWFEVGGKKVTRKPALLTDDTVAVCKVKRRGYAPVESTFSMAEAKIAQLPGKPGPWQQYPTRMLQMRARAFALRDQFGDALRGFRSTEEAGDEPKIEVEVERPALFALPPTQTPAPTPEPENSAPPPLVQGAAEVNQEIADSGPVLDPLVVQLTELVTGLGVTFDKFHTWAQEHFGEASEWVGFESVQPAVAKTIMRARARFTAQMESLR